MISKTKTERNFSYLLKITVVFFIFLTAVILFSKISFAQGIAEDLNVDSIADQSGLTSSVTPGVFIANIIKIILAVIGVIFLIIVIVAGAIWMTSGGNQEKIAKAKKMIVAGVIGMAIIVFSYVIVTFIVKAIWGGISGPGGGSGNGGGSGYTDFGTGALGGGVIEYHYPQREARNIPRNTKIMINFKVPVATTSVIKITDTEDGSFPSGTEGANLCSSYTNGNANACGKLNAELIQITDNGTVKEPEDVVAVLSADGKNIVLDPIEAIGLAERDTITQVCLSSDMKTADDKDLFGGVGTCGYNWRFYVSTFLDNTAPTVDFVWPEANEEVARNAIIQVTFSEPIDILTITETNFEVKYGSNIISGTRKISNQFKTVEFLSSLPCGVGDTLNSCGEQVFCLPGDETITTLLKSGLTGITDASGNSLDGDLTQAGSQDYSWSFRTNNNLNITAPIILTISPSNDATDVSLNTPISATFDSTLSPSSVNTENFYIYNFSACGGDNDGKKTSITGSNCFPNYGVSVNTDPNNPIGTENKNNRVNIKIYRPYLEGGMKVYRPRLTSDIKDSYGNCFWESVGPNGNTDQN